MREMIWLGGSNGSGPIVGHGICEGRSSESTFSDSHSAPPGGGAPPDEDRSRFSSSKAAKICSSVIEGSQP